MKMSKILITRGELRQMIHEAVESLDDELVFEEIDSTILRKTYGTQGTKRDTTATKPFTKSELRLGADVNTQDSKKPSLMQRVKGALGLGEKEKPTGFENAPEGLSAVDLQKFHREKAINARNKAKEYDKRFVAAREANDAKKSEHMRKMQQFFARAAQDHEEALKRSK
jgi:hypothetical protein